MACFEKFYIQCKFSDHNKYMIMPKVRFKNNTH